MLKRREYYALFWDYLMRSEAYKEFCKCSGNMTPTAIFHHDFHDDFNRRFNVDLLDMFRLFRDFGDIYSSKFDDFWSAFQRINVQNGLAVVKLGANEATKMLFVGFYASIRRVFNDQESMSLKKLTSLCGDFVAYTSKLNEDDGLWIYIDPRINKTATLIAEDVRKIVLRKRKDQSINIAQNLSETVCDALIRYIKVYDLKKQGMSNVEIGGAISLYHNKYANNNMADDHVRKEINRDYLYAKRIIKNAERYQFPGRYNSQ